MATNLTAKFRGKVQQEHYQQPIVKDAQGDWIGVFESQTFEFEGLTQSEAMTDGEVTCTDVAGTSYTFYLRESYTDASTGSGFLAKEDCRVSRRRTSPHMWSVTFTRIGGKFLKNGVVFYEGPTWMDRYNS